MKFSDPQLEIINSTAQVNLFHAGVGSGKTYLIGFRQAYFAKHYPFVRGFIGANTYEQLNKSTLVGVFKFWAQIGLKRDRDYVVDTQPPEHFKIYGERLKSYKNTISFYTGRLIFLASLTNYEAIDGVEFCDADLDETKDTEEAAVKEVILARMRQKGLWITKAGDIITDEELAISTGAMGFNPLNMYTSPAKTDWLAEWFDFQKYADEILESIFSKTDYFRKRVGNKLMVISSTYHNEDNLPKGYIEEKIIEPNAHNEHRVNMLLYGSPLAKSGNEYFNRFDRTKHVKERECPDNVAIHVTFDFNRVPYIPAGLFKTWYDDKTNRWQVHKFDEVCLKPPNNTTDHLCDEIIRLYGHMFTKGLFYYGDYSGDNRRTNSVDTDYDVIKRKLHRFIGNTSNRVIVNEPVVQRKEFMNKILYGSVPIDYTISPKCINTIKDCEYLQEAADGGKLKKEAVDDSGVRYQKYGHCADHDEYFFTSCFNKYYKQK